MAVRFGDVDLDTLPFAKQATKANNTLVVPLEPAIRIKTDLLTSTTPLCDENNDILPNIYARAQGPFLKFLKDFEQAVLTGAKNNAQAWWPKPPTTAMIDNGFKSSFRNEDVFKMTVKQTADPLVFDHEQKELPDQAAGCGVKFWAVLEAQRVVIGRQEFGLVWKLSHMMLKPAAKCELTLPTADDPEADDGDFL